MDALETGSCCGVMEIHDFAYLRGSEVTMAFVEEFKEHSGNGKRRVLGCLSVYGLAKAFGVSEHTIKWIRKIEKDFYEPNDNKITLSDAGIVLALPLNMKITLSDAGIMLALTLNMIALENPKNSAVFYWAKTSMPPAQEKSFVRTLLKLDVEIKMLGRSNHDGAAIRMGIFSPKIKTKGDWLATEIAVGARTRPALREQA